MACTEDAQASTLLEVCARTQRRIEKARLCARSWVHLEAVLEAARFLQISNEFFAEMACLGEFRPVLLERC